MLIWLIGVIEPFFYWSCFTFTSPADIAKIGAAVGTSAALGCFDAGNSVDPLAIGCTDVDWK